MIKREVILEKGKVMFRKGMRWRALGIREPVRGLKVVRSGKRRT